MTICLICGGPLIPWPRVPAHPWRHEDTGFMQCFDPRVQDRVWAVPLPEGDTAEVPA